MGLTGMCDNKLLICCPALVPGILASQLGIVSIGPHYIQTDTVLFMQTHLVKMFAPQEKPTLCWPQLFALHLAKSSDTEQADCDRLA